VFRQFVAVRAEGVGLDQLRSGVDISPVNATHEVGLAQVQAIKAGVDGDTARV
jgi:hypothetical protein